VPTFGEYTLAAEIEGKIKPAPLAKPVPPADEKDEAKGAAGEKKPAEPKPPKEVDLHVVLVADIDMLSDAFFQLREMGESQENEINFQFDNVAFVLNVLDKLAGDERFIEIRKRRPHHHTLTRIEKETQAAQDDEAKAHEEYLNGLQKDEEDLIKEMEDELKDLQNQKDADPMQQLIRVQIKQQELNRKMEVKLEQKKKVRRDKYNKIETNLNQEKAQYQKKYKIMAVILPPIPPLLVAIVVFSLRRKREREGVAKSRLR
jgi:ABC-2 type transport system permease protein